MSRGPLRSRCLCSFLQKRATLDIYHKLSLRTLSVALLVRPYTILSVSLTIVSVKLSEQLQIQPRNHKLKLMPKKALICEIRGLMSKICADFHLIFRQQNTNYYIRYTKRG